MFVLGATSAKQSALRGTSSFTNTAFANLTLAFFWVVVGFMRGEPLPIAAWAPAVAIAGAFVMGQLCTYLAFQFGDVSLATPIFGVKIIIVAMLSATVSDQPITAPLWVAAVLAAVGIGVVQAGPRPQSPSIRTAGRATLTVILALLAATALSLFDIGLQHYGRVYGAERFLILMFIFSGVLSCGLLPWADSPARIIRINAQVPLLIAAVMMAAQAVSISYALGRFGDATRVNIVYSLRGLWSVLLAWVLGRLATTPDAHLHRGTLLYRLSGAMLLLIAVLVALL